MQKTQFKLYTEHIIGCGAYSVVYSHHIATTDHQIAIKMFKKLQNSQNIEDCILKKLQKQQGFPQYFGCYQPKEDQQAKNINQWIAMSKLGDSLKKKMKFPHSLDEIVSLSIQMIERIQILHSYGFLHRDIKPDNFLFGRKQSEREILHLIDFNLSLPIISDCNRTQNLFKGNIGYGSINQMLCGKTSIRDDLESIVYIIGELLTTKLPWQELIQQVSHKDLVNPKRINKIVKKIIKMKMGCNWGQNNGWICEALRIVGEQDEMKVYNKLKAWVFRLFE